jgi:hypothetical protein
MNWKKIGLIFCANKESELMFSGGRAPVVKNLKDDFFDIYFASYDKQLRGNIFKLTININNPLEVLSINLNPLITFGDIGYYDDNGIIPSCLMEYRDKIYLYTIGFSVKNKIIFDAASGLAISSDNGETFVKFKGPVLDRGIDDPSFAASPFVIFDEGIFKMWFVSCDKWVKNENGSYKHFYNIKYKESTDGISWSQKSKVCIDYKNEYEYAISRPSVIKDGNLYKMWYSYRAQKLIDTYRIGYAESHNGIDWVRKDELMSHFNVSISGWDSEMVCYPYVFKHLGKLYMLYNGNGYGKSGFGIAVMDN